MHSREQIPVTEQDIVVAAIFKVRRVFRHGHKFRAGGLFQFGHAAAVIDVRMAMIRIFTSEKLKPNAWILPSI